MVSLSSNLFLKYESALIVACYLYRSYIKQNVRREVYERAEKMHQT